MNNNKHRCQYWYVNRVGESIIESNNDPICRIHASLRQKPMGLLYNFPPNLLKVSINISLKQYVQGPLLVVWINFNSSMDK